MIETNPFTQRTRTGEYPSQLNLIPEFDRLPFRYGFDDEQDIFKENENYDVIVKKPRMINEKAIPVGIVSKQYALIQHRNLFKTVIDAVRDLGFPVHSIVDSMWFSKYWEGLYFTIKFPKKYWIDPGDGFPIAPRLMCINSVDGRSRLKIEMGWQRLICSNGMTSFEKSNPINLRHIGNININIIQKIIRAGLDSTLREKNRFQKWLDQTVAEETVAQWIDREVKGKWGVKAAVRTFHICLRGMDVEIEPFSKGKPSEKYVTEVEEVPGSNAPAKNLYAVSQALAWIASRKKDVDERLAWQRMIPGMIESLTRNLN